MRILGIDPGYAIVGYGALDYAAGRLAVGEYGAITTPAHTLFEERLVTVYDEMEALIARTQPLALAMETLFYAHNQSTVIYVAEARGVILLAARKAGVPVFEYTPLQVKQSVVGYGRAEKKQVMEMTKRLLHLQAIPRPDDAADALALALCHARSASSLLNRETRV